MAFIIKILEIFFTLLEGMLKFGLEAVGAAFTRDHRYKAEFAPAGTLLSSSFWGSYGFCLTGSSNLSVKDSYQNALVVGGTGTGKSSVILIPSLFTMRGSFIVHDPSGELFAKSAGFLKYKGYDIKILHFANGDVSSGYNPLQRAKSSSEINKVASLLIDNALGGNKAKDPFWNTQASALLVMLITILKKQPEMYQNLYNVRLLLSAMGGNPEAVDRLFSRNADAGLWSEYKSFLSYDDKVINGVIATGKAALNFVQDETLATITSYDSIDFNDFRKKPSVLYIQNSVSDMRYYSVLTSIFFEQFFSHVMSRFPKEEEQDIFFLIDECASLQLPTLPMATANIRKHRGGIMLILQDFNQLVHHYGKEAQAIKSNCFAKLYLPGQDIETAKELEQTLGKYEYEDKENKRNIRSLLTADEIRIMPSNRALFICGNHPPIRVKLTPYYESIEKRRQSAIPPPEMKNENALCLAEKSIQRLLLNPIPNLSAVVPQGGTKAAAA